MQEKDWNKLEDKFKKERAILFLGPKLASIKKANQWLPLEEVVAMHFMDIFKQNNISIEKEDSITHNLPYVTQKYLMVNQHYDRVDLDEEVESFWEDYDQNFPEDDIPKIYKKAAQLPVKIYITTAFDRKIEQALRAEKKQPQFSYYNFALSRESERQLGTKNKRINVEEISIERPLVFNLFGVFENSESLVLTQSDQIKFLEKVLAGNPALPDELLYFFAEKKKSCIFIGFDLNAWQYRLIMSTLKLQESNINFINYSEFKIPISNKEFYQDKKAFSFVFAPHEVEQFLTHLVDRIEEKYQEKSIKFHIICCEQDIDAKLALEKQLEPVKSFTTATSSHSIHSSKRKEALQKWIDVADHILLFIHPDLFFNNDFNAYEIELALQKKTAQPDTQIIPILSESYSWKDMDAFPKLSPPIPKEEIPVKSEHWRNLDTAMYQVVVELKKRLLK